MCLLTGQMCILRVFGCKDGTSSRLDLSTCLRGWFLWFSDGGTPLFPYSVDIRGVSPSEGREGYIGGCQYKWFVA
jgi:hypothetical protein